MGPKENKENIQPKFKFSVILWVTLLIFAIHYYSQMTESETIPYSQFLQLIDANGVRKVVISERIISGELVQSEKPFRTIATRDDSLFAKLHQKKIDFRIENASPAWGFLLAWGLPLLFIYWIWKMSAGNLAQKAGGILSFTKSRAKIYVDKDVRTTFSDVAGVDEAKNELSEIVNFLQDPHHYSRLGGRAPKGILLVGPPGTGKTLLARAVAGEAKVPFFSINGSEFVELFVGLGAARVRDLFEQARQQAPCILFIDEIDALGKSRALGFTSMGANDEKEQTLNQLLAEMDGFDPTTGIIMVAATNRPEVLDPALLRAGRFDRQVLLNKPDQIGREKILLVHSKKIQLEENLNLKTIASLTSGFSGADLANLVNEAALVATRRNASAVNEADFSQALERIVAGIEHKGKVMNKKEKERIAFHELGHATVALDLSATDKVYKVSIIPRSIGALGYTLQRPTEDRYVIDEDELMQKIAVLLGGRASEKLFLQKISTGASDDLAKATDLARSMVTQFGMSEVLGMTSFESRRLQWLQSPLEGSAQAMSEISAARIDAEIKKILDQAFDMATESLKRHRQFIETAQKKLIEKETLTESEILSLWSQSKANAKTSSLTSTLSDREH